MSCDVRICAKCGGTEYGKSGQCKACAREASRRYIEKNKEAIRARQNQLRKAKRELSPAKIKHATRADAKKAWRIANPEKVAAQRARAAEKAKQKLTVEELRAVLHYDQDTGIFKWLDDRKRGLKDKNAGSIHHDGYLIIHVNNKNYSAHRLAWMYVYGDLPTFDLDHINRNRADNRISNLRKSCDAENGQNKGIAKNNKSGVRGVHWCKEYGAWRASIRVSGRLMNLGRFKAIEDAAMAYLQASKLHHPFNFAEGRNV